jgi:hypothetical protein
LIDDARYVMDGPDRRYRERKRKLDRRRARWFPKSLYRPVDRRANEMCLTNEEHEDVAQMIDRIREIQDELHRIDDHRRMQAMVAASLAAS